MKNLAAFGFAAALFAAPAGAFACDACGHKGMAHHPAPRPQYIPAASYAPACPPPVAYAPVASYAPACPQPCFNPLSVVGGVVSGVGAAVGAIGSGIAGAFGTCNPCY